MQVSYPKVAELPDLILEDFILSQFPADFHGSYLTFGDSVTPIRKKLYSNGWDGFHITPNKPDKKPFFDETLIVAELTPDPRIIKMMGGIWARSLTLDEVFLQFGGPYHIIGMVNTDQDRALWYHASIQASLPKVYILGEDGHNEDVIAVANDRGYKGYILGDALVLVRDESS